jgi:hypothetical protein
MRPTRPLLAFLLVVPILAGCATSATSYHTVAHSALPAPTLRDGQPLGAKAAVAGRVGGLLTDDTIDGGAHMTVAARQGGGEVRFGLGPHADVGVYYEDLGGRVSGDATPRPRPEANGHLLGANWFASAPLGDGVALAGWIDLASAAVPLVAIDLDYGGTSDEQESKGRFGAGAILSVRRGPVTGFAGVSGSQMFTGFTRALEYDEDKVETLGVWTVHAGLGAELARGARLNVVTWALGPGQRVGLGPCAAVELVVPFDR